MLKLNNGFKIEADNDNVMLIETKHATAGKDSKLHKEGETYQKDVVLGYFTNVPRALSAYVDVMIARKVETSEMTIPDLIQEIRELKESILNLTK